MIVEPMLAASGCIPGDVGFLRGLREQTKAYGTMLLFDEVMTSRLSTAGLQGLYGIQPDLTKLGKYLAGGLSFGAFGGRKDVMTQVSFDGALTHGGTFNNNEFSINAGVATLRDMLTEGELQLLNSRGDDLRRALLVALAPLSGRMTVTGLGSLLTFHSVGGPVV